MPIPIFQEFLHGLLTQNERKTNHWAFITRHNWQYSAMCLFLKLKFCDLSYKSKNIAIQIVCYSLRSSATMKKQRNIESFEGRNNWASKVAPNQVCGVHNSRFYILLTVHHVMILGKWPTWCTNSFLCVFISIYNSLRVSSTQCSSSGETNCINTASGNSHSFYFYL
jgi:hypothetical protein